MKKESITMMVSAYNEEKHLEKAVTGLNNLLENMFEEYEIIIFDDKSSDQTGKIADDLAKNDARIKVVHNKVNKGLGYNYRESVRLAKYDYFSFIPGDDGVQANSIKSILEFIGTADIIIPFTANTHVRPAFRRIMSWGFTAILNLLFGMHLNYYNGMVVHKTDIL
ncbi:glycosyltransferase family 2 protein [Candidatus Woesearchaeota archaeon]|nr:glycosyltransferase family 2 protein [Candidatus Woesearchaeota archaeon]